MDRNVEVLWLMLFGATIVVPLFGGLFLWAACRLLRVGNVGYLRCWMAYFAAYSTASILATGLGYVMLSASGESANSVWNLSAGSLALIGIVVVGAHVVLVPLILRIGFGKALLAQGIALVAYGIVLTAALTPLVIATRHAALRTVSVGNLVQLGRAMHSFAGEHEGCFPNVANCLPDEPNTLPQSRQPLLSWRVHLLPYLDQVALYEQFHLDEPWDSPHNITLLDKMPHIYAPVIKADTPANSTYYQVFVHSPEPNHPEFYGPYPIFVPVTLPHYTHNRGINLGQITDGTSMTILVAEGGKTVPWTKPEDLPYTPGKPLPSLGGQFEGDFCVLMADGSVSFIRRDVDPAVLKAAITSNGRDGEQGDMLNDFSR